MGLDPVNNAAEELGQPKEEAFVLLCHGERGHKSRMQPNSQARTGARPALALLLGINLFCYLDRYILASIIPAIKSRIPRRRSRREWRRPVC